MRRQKPTRHLVPTVAGRTHSACSVECLRSGDPAKGELGWSPPPGPETQKIVRQESVRTDLARFRYIKELADRINTIEGRLSTNVEGAERRPSSESFVSPGLVDDNRKRPFSTISGEGFQTPSPNRLSSTFNSEHRPILPYVEPDFRPQMPGNSTDHALKTTAPLPYPASTNDMSLQGQPDMMATMAQVSLPQGSSHQADQLPEIDDVVFNR